MAQLIAVVVVVVEVVLTVEVLEYTNVAVTVVVE
jgi:hypothetical protein